METGNSIQEGTVRGTYLSLRPQSESDMESLRAHIGKGGGRKMPHELRVELFHVIKRLREEGMSYTKIQAETERRYDVNLSKSNISRWIRGISLPQREVLNKPRLDDSPELAWSAGVSVGDGSLRVTKRGWKLFTLNVKDKDFAEQFAVVLARIMGREKPYSILREKNGSYYVKVQSKALVDFLKDTENVLRLLEKFSEDFIRGFFDSEGHPHGRIDFHGYFRYYISASNTDKELLEKIRAKLAETGITSTLYMQYNAGTVFKTPSGVTVARKNCYAILIRGQRNIRAYWEKIGFVVKRKREKLADIVNILERCRKRKRAAIEWIRRYERRPKGREKWIKRETSLSDEEAKRAYEEYLQKKE